MYAPAPSRNPLWRAATVVLGMAGLRLDRGTAHRPARLLLFGLMTAMYYVTLPWLVTPAVATVSS